MKLQLNQNSSAPLWVRNKYLMVCQREFCSPSNRAEGMKVPRLERHPLCIIKFLNLIRKGMQAQALFVLTWTEMHTKEMTHRRLKDLGEIVVLHLILETLHDLYPLSMPMEIMKVNTRCTSESWQLWPLGEGTGIYRWQDSLQAHHTTLNCWFPGSLRFTGIPQPIHQYSSTHRKGRSANKYPSLQFSPVIPETYHVNPFDVNL